MKRLIALFLLIAAPAAADIVLTVPEAVRAEIGAATTVNYDRIRVTNISTNPQDNSVNVSFELFVSSDGARPALRGQYSISVNDSSARIQVEGLGIDTGVTLNAGQRTTVISNVDQHRDNVENSMISFGLVDGSQQ